MNQQVNLSLQLPEGELTAAIGLKAAQLQSLQLASTQFIQQHLDAPEIPWSAGIIMAPWVNRIEDGVWHQNGQEYRLPITEPKFNNAIHGLLTHTNFEILARTESAVRLGATIKPTPGYPFEIEFRVEYHLVKTGISVRHIAINHGSQLAPFATGAHPYFVLGDEPLDRATIRVAARTYTATDERMLPVSREFTDKSSFDLSGGVPINSLRIDTTFGNLARDDSGMATASIIGSNLGIELWQDTSFTNCHIFITDKFDGPQGKCLAIAIEPTTGPANNFNTGEGLIWLSPEKVWRGTWGVRLLNL